MALTTTTPYRQSHYVGEYAGDAAANAAIASVGWALSKGMIYFDNTGAVDQLKLYDGVAWRLLITEDNALWSETSNVVHPTTLTNDVAIGANAVDGVERLYILDEVEDSPGIGVLNQLQKDSTGTKNFWTGYIAEAVHYGAGAGTNYRGFEATADIDNAAAVISNLIGFVFDPFLIDGAITTETGYYSQPSISASKTVGTHRGFHADGVAGSGTATKSVGLAVDDMGANSTTAYGVEIAAQTGTTARGIYCDDSIELTGTLVFQENSDHTVDPAAGRGMLWVRDDSPNVLIFTDDDGIDHVLGEAVTSPWNLTSGVIHPATLANDVAVGRSTMVGNEKVLIFDDNETADVVGATAYLEKNSTGTKSSFTGFLSEVAHTGGAGATQYAGFACLDTINNAAATVALLYGLEFKPTLTDGAITTACGAYAQPTVASGKTIGLYRALHADGIAGLGTVTKSVGVEIEDMGANSTTTYGIEIEAQVGTTARGIYCDDSIELTGTLVLGENPDHTVAPAAGTGLLWVRDDTPNVLVFTDDTGTDTVLGSGGSSPWTQDTGFIYLTTTTDSVVIGDTALTGSESLKVDGGDILVEGGNVNIPATSSATVGVYEIGGVPFLHNYGTRSVHVGNGGNFTAVGFTDSIAIGDGALDGPTGTPDSCIAIGTNALGAAFTSFSNQICIGVSAGASLTTNSQNNVVIGNSAYSSATATGGRNSVVIGHSAAAAVDSGDNVIVGYRAAENATGTIANNSVIIGSYACQTGVLTAGGNVVIGFEAGEVMTAAGSCVILGREAAKALTSGDFNVAIGMESLYSNNSGGENVSIGYRSMAAYAAAAIGAMNRNVAIGNESLQYITASTNNNVAIGYRAMYYVDQGSAPTNNVAIGYEAGNSATTGVGSSGCVLIGYQAGRNNVTSNRLIIENSSDITTPLIDGDFSTDTVRINDTLKVNTSEAGSPVGYIVVEDTEDSADRVGVYSLYSKTATGSGKQHYSFAAKVELTAAATVDSFRNLDGEITVDNASGVLTTARGAVLEANATNGTIASYRGVDIRTTTSSGTITNSYGVYINAMNGGTDSYGIYQADTGDSNYFAGPTAMGANTFTSDSILTVNDTKFDGLSYGVTVDHDKSNTDASNSHYSFSSTISHTGAVGASTYESFNGLFELNAAGQTISIVRGVRVYSVITNGTITNYDGIRIETLPSSGTVTNAKGVYISAMNGTSESYGIYQSSSGDINYFNGQVSVRDVAPPANPYIYVVDNEDSAGTRYGVEVELEKDGPGTGKSHTSFYSYINWTDGGGNSIYGTNSAMTMNATGDTVTTFAGQLTRLTMTNGTVTNFYGTYVDDISFGSGTVNTAYGLYIGDLSGANDSYGIYQSNEDDRNYFAGPTGIQGTNGSLDVSLLVTTTDDVGQPVGVSTTFAKTTATGGGSYAWTCYKGYAAHTGAVDANFYKGYEYECALNASGRTVGTVYGFTSKLTKTLGTVTTYYGFAAESNSGSGTVTNAYGVYVASQNGGTLSYGIYQFSANDDNYFNGNVGIKDTTPNYPLDVNGDINVSTSGVYRYNGNQVVTGRQTGWSAPTGTSSRATFATGTVTVSQLAERVKALLEDLGSSSGHGLIDV